MSDAELRQLELRLDYQFRDSDLLIQALSHRSYGHEFNQSKPIALRDNERLEFLGDAVLDLVISDVLLETFPNAHEGQLSKMRAAVVNEKTLADVARSIHVSESIRLGKGEAQTGGREKASILSSTFEALVAAIYLDGGFEPIYNVVRQLFSPLFEDEKELMSFYDYKTQLQEMVQARWKVTPTYHLVESSGPDHAKIFEVEVRMNEKSIGSATGTSKKIAEQSAARQAVENMGDV